MINKVEWKKNGGVLLIGYEMFRTLLACKSQSKKQKISTSANNCIRHSSQVDEIIDLEEEDNQNIKFNGN
jgi:hypothetical protein